jgi:glycosyltransferase involved in cell wall biosynthesis
MEIYMTRQLVVLMTAYNAEATIRRALDSIARNGRSFDILIVDDCSERPLAEFLSRDYLDSLGSVEIIRPERNLGVAGAKNFGLERLLAKPYEYVAMMDADDVSRPERLAKQVAFLEAHPEVALVGAWARFFDETTRDVVFHFQPACESRDIRESLFLNSCIMHPSWMVRTHALRETGLYSHDYPAAEDYELLCRMSKSFGLANLPEFLLDYSVSMGGISMKNRRRQLIDRARIQWKYFDATRPKAWIGLARTLALFAVPNSALSAYRWSRGRVQEWRQRAAGGRGETPHPELQVAREQLDAMLPELKALSMQMGERAPAQPQAADRPSVAATGR